MDKEELKEDKKIPEKKRNEPTSFLMKWVYGIFIVSALIISAFCTTPEYRH